MIYDFLYYGFVFILIGGLKIIVCYLFFDEFLYLNIKESIYSFSILIYLQFKDFCKQDFVLINII